MYDIQKGKQHVHFFKETIKLLFVKRLHIDFTVLICPKTMQQFTSTVNYE